jgi:hypothetical protein
VVHGGALSATVFRRIDDEYCCANAAKTLYCLPDSVTLDGPSPKLKL